MGALCRTGFPQLVLLGRRSIAARTFLFRWEREQENVVFFVRAFCTFFFFSSFFCFVCVLCMHVISAYLCVYKVPGVCLFSSSLSFFCCCFAFVFSPLLSFVLYVFVFSFVFCLGLSDTLAAR